MCQQHTLPTNKFFPHLIGANLPNGTVVESPYPRALCWLTVALPSRLPYSYTIQFVGVMNRNPSPSVGGEEYYRNDTRFSKTELVICEGNSTFVDVCQAVRYRVPIRHGLLPQSISLRWAKTIILKMKYSIGCMGSRHSQAGTPFISKDVSSIPMCVRNHNQT